MGQTSSDLQSRRGRRNASALVDSGASGHAGFALGRQAHGVLGEPADLLLSNRPPGKSVIPGEVAQQLTKQRVEKKPNPIVIVPRRISVIIIFFNQFVCT